MSNLLISVVIPSCHRNELLAKCLDRLAPDRQTLSSNRYEVIVSDDGTQTTAEAMIKQSYPWVCWVAGPCKGSPAANRNCGAKVATGEWLVFTDDDCLPADDWLSAFAQAIHAKAIALEGAIHASGDLSLDMAECPVNLEGGCFWSANIAVRRDIFFEIGGFDESYPYAAYEDVDLYWRLKKLAIIPFISEAKVVHPVRVMSLNASLTRIPKICASWAYHTKKHQDSLGYQNDLKAALGCLSNGRGIFYALKQGHFQAGIMRLAYFIVGVPFTYYYRVTSQ